MHFLMHKHGSSYKYAFTYEFVCKQSQLSAALLKELYGADIFHNIPKTKNIESSYFSENFPQYFLVFLFLPHIHVFFQKSSTTYVCFSVCTLNVQLMYFSVAIRQSLGTLEHSRFITCVCLGSVGKDDRQYPTLAAPPSRYPCVFTHESGHYCPGHIGHCSTELLYIRYLTLLMATL